MSQKTRRTRPTENLDRRSIMEILSQTEESVEPCGVPSVSDIAAQIEGDQIEAREIYQSIARSAAHVSNVLECALLLPPESSKNSRDPSHTPEQLEVVAHSGDFQPEQIKRALSEEPAQITSATPAKCLTSGEYRFFAVICAGSQIGYLAIRCEGEISDNSAHILLLLSSLAGFVFERGRRVNSEVHLNDRLQVLTGLNMLIARNVGLDRIAKSITAESALHFAADLVIIYLHDELQHSLEVRGRYGCSPGSIPNSYRAHDGLLFKAVQHGSLIAVENLAQHQNHGLDFIEKLGFRSVVISCLEVDGEVLGALVLGYRRDGVMSEGDSIRLEEFCQAAAVAIANARVQERLREYTEHLEREVEQRTQDLQVQTLRAEEANHAKSRFLANMSHELRTPLTAIVGYSSVLADGIFGPLNDRQTDAMLAISRSSEHLKNLINDVLNLARIESGKEDPEPARVPLHDLLTQSHKLLLQTAIAKGVSLQPLVIDPALNGGALFTDPKHTQQIMNNLLSNAIKYTPQGGKVWIESSIVGDKVRIAIHDTGVGMSQQKLERLFERFERGEDDYSKSQEGTGIGLNLTKHLVEINGGRIGVDSTEGQGSIFWIMMPLETKAFDVADEQEQKTSSTEFEGNSFLVVDDNPDTCEVLRCVLSAAGAEAVVTARNVREGVQALEQHRFDFILTDLTMPGESGLSLVSHVRGLRTPTAKVPIIVLSACAFEADREAALNAGASAFVAKPFKPSDVVKNIQTLRLRSAFQGVR